MWVINPFWIFIYLMMLFSDPQENREARNANIPCYGWVEHLATQWYGGDPNAPPPCPAIPKKPREKPDRDPRAPGWRN
jgi:hypothetical protein